MNIWMQAETHEYQPAQTTALDQRVMELGSMIKVLIMISHQFHRTVEQHHVHVHHRT